MVTAAIVYQIERVSRSMPEMRFSRKKYIASQEEVEVTYCQEADVRSLRTNVLRWVDHLQRRYKAGKVSLETLKFGTLNAHALFNIDPELAKEWILQQASEQQESP